MTDPEKVCRACGPNTCFDGSGACGASAGGAGSRRGSRVFTNLTSRLEATSTKPLILEDRRAARTSRETAHWSSMPMCRRDSKFGKFAMSSDSGCPFRLSYREVQMRWRWTSVDLEPKVEEMHASPGRADVLNLEGQRHNPTRSSGHVGRVEHRIPN